MILHRGGLVRFGIVGSIGFAVDLGILAVLVHGAGWNPLMARLVAMGIAVTCTWLLHRNWTFSAGRLRSPLQQSLLYGMVQILSLSLNYAVFSVLLLSGDIWRSFPVLAAAAGSLCAMTITYVFCKRIAFAEPGATAKSVSA